MRNTDKSIMFETSIFDFIVESDPKMRRSDREFRIIKDYGI